MTKTTQIYNQQETKFSDKIQLSSQNELQAILNKHQLLSEQPISEVEKRLLENNIKLNNSVSSPLGLYTPVKISENRLAVSGQLPRNRSDKSLMRGYVSLDSSQSNHEPLPSVSPKYAKEAAANTTIDMLSTLKFRLAKVNRTLDDIEPYTMDVMVNVADSKFEGQAGVANGASEVLIAAFGEESGRVARTAVGLASLPLGATIEISYGFSFKPGKEVALLSASNLR